MRQNTIIRLEICAVKNELENFFVFLYYITKVYRVEWVPQWKPEMYSFTGRLGPSDLGIATSSERSKYNTKTTWMKMWFCTATMDHDPTLKHGQILRDPMQK